MITFLDVKQSSIADIAGVCPDSAKFASLVNDATRRLLRRGDWVGTLQTIQICANQGCLVMPRYVQAIRKLSLCNEPLPVGNLWYRFITADSCGGYGSCGAFYSHATNLPGALHSNGQACCYNDIPGDGWYVRAYPTVLDDVGKTVTIYGVDNDNQPLRTNNLNGTWSDGWVISLAVDYGSPLVNNTPSGSYVRRITRVVKEATQGQVRLYAYKPTTGELYDLAVYDPGETSPTYARYSLHVNTLMSGSTCGTAATSCCSTVHSIIALIKMRFIPAQYDTDLVIIDNLDALKDMIQAVKLREAGDTDASFKMEASAVRELNRDLEDNFPDDTFSAQNNVLGPYEMTNQAF